MGETTTCAKTFISEFIPKGGQYSSNNFKTLRWIQSTSKMWWAQLVGYMFNTHEQVLKEIGLYQAIRNVQYGIR